MADGKLQLEIVTPARRVLSQAVDSVRAPGAEGSFGVLPGHTPFVAQIRAGELVAVSGGDTLVFAVGEGFVQVAANKVLVLTEQADRPEEIDADAAKGEVDAETKKLLAMKDSDEGYEIQRARVERAAARVAVVGRR